MGKKVLRKRGRKPKKEAEEIRYQNGTNIDLDTVLSGLLSPDTINAYEFEKAYKNKDKFLEPEKNMMLAMLEDAVDCIQREKSKNFLADKPRREAEEWILCEDNSSLFSFNNVCEILGLDPDYLRRGLSRFSQSKAA